MQPIEWPIYKVKLKPDKEGFGIDVDRQRDLDGRIVGEVMAS